LRQYFSALVLVLGLAVAPVAAHASPVTYDVVLNSLTGNTGNGSGSFTINNPPTAPVSDYNSADGSLINLSFIIGGDVFNLGNALNGYGEVDFLHGILTNVFYNGGDITKSVAFQLNSGLLLYSFNDFDKGEHSTGYISATVDPSGNSPVPEPTTLLLFGTGMLGLGALASRKLA
jgi:PEP-CTERM motif